MANANSSINARRGEIEAVIGGERRTLVLTLGALAELEQAFAVDDIMALGERFASGRLASRDIIRVVGAGLRGAGASISDDELANLSIEGGASMAAKHAFDLLRHAFGVEEKAAEEDTNPRVPRR
ncbi:MAG: gene transfer agent family protein [Bosea sp. (in: a-proteobacteria)]